MARMGRALVSTFFIALKYTAVLPPPYSRPLHPHPPPLSHTPLTPVDVEHTLRVGHVGTARGRRDCTEAAALGEIRFGAREDLGGGGGGGGWVGGGGFRWRGVCWRGVVGSQIGTSGRRDDHNGDMKE